MQGPSCCLLFRGWVNTEMQRKGRKLGAKPACPVLRPRALSLVIQLINTGRDCPLHGPMLLVCREAKPQRRSAVEK